MNIALWIISGLLALIFLGSGAMKLAQSNEKLATSGLAWVEGFSTASVKTIGVLEVLAAIGLILPVALGVLPVLAPLAAIGVGLMMTGALIMHLRRREPQGIVVSGILLALALVVIVGWIVL